MDIDETPSKDGQELDRVYHAIPEWVHRMNPNASPSEKVKKGFAHVQELFTDTVKTNAEEREKKAAFLAFVFATHGLDYMTEYWAFLTRQSPAETRSQPIPAPLDGQTSLPPQ